METGPGGMGLASGLILTPNPGPVGLTESAQICISDFAHADPSSPMGWLVSHTAICCWHATYLSPGCGATAISSPSLDTAQASQLGYSSADQD